MVFARASSRFAAASLRASPLARPSPIVSAARQTGAIRTLTATSRQQGKVLLILYDVCCFFISNGIQRCQLTKTTGPRARQAGA